MDKTPDQVRATIEKRLDDPKVKALLTEIFLQYHKDLLPILVIATAEADGVRPEGLSNEMYACLHHMARGVCVEGANPEAELESARKSHIKRATLDSYKIAIHSYLAELSQAKDLLDYMVLIKEFSAYIPDGIQKAKEVKDLGAQVKNKYRAARFHEMRGAFDDANISFSDCLELCEKLREKLEVFTSDRTYIFACEREASRKIEQSRDMKIKIFVPIVCAILAALLTYCVPKLLSSSSGQIPGTSDSRPVEPNSKREVESKPSEQSLKLPAASGQ